MKNIATHPYCSADIPDPEAGSYGMLFPLYPANCPECCGELEVEKEEPSTDCEDGYVVLKCKSCGHTEQHDIPDEEDD